MANGPLGRALCGHPFAGTSYRFKTQKPLPLAQLGGAALVQLVGFVPGGWLLHRAAISDPLPVPSAGAGAARGGAGAGSRRSAQGEA